MQADFSSNQNSVKDGSQLEYQCHSWNLPDNCFVFSNVYYDVHCPALQHLHVSPVIVERNGRECISRVQTLPAAAPCWRELLCSVIGESGSQQQSSGAPFPCYRAQTHLPLAPPISPHPPPLGMIISPPLHRTIIFQVRSSPSLLSFFMACFCPCAALHICTVPVQYVKEVNIVCSVQNVISIYLFSLLVIYWFFWCLRKKASSSHVS